MAFLQKEKRMKMDCFIRVLSILMFIYLANYNLWGMESPVIHLAYSRSDGNRAYLVNTPDGVCIFTKTYKKNYSSHDPNDTCRAFLIDMNGVVGKHIWQGDSYPIIAAAYNEQKAYLLCVGENGNQKIVTVFDNNGNLVKRHTFDHKISSATPIKIGADIGFILVTKNDYAKAFIWFLSDDDEPSACLQHNDQILACAGVDSQRGYQILTGSSNIACDGFMRVWDYEKLSRERFGKSEPRVQINSLSWWSAFCSTVCKSLPEGVINLLPSTFVNSHDYQDHFVDLAAIQSQEGDVFFVAGSENGAKIGKLKEGGVEFQPDIAFLRGGLVSCVAALRTFNDDLFLVPFNEKIYIYTVYGDYVTELDFNKEQDLPVDGLSTLCKDNKVYIVLRNEEKFFSWILNAKSYEIIEHNAFSIQDCQFN